VYGQGFEALQGAVDEMFERVHMPFVRKGGDLEGKRRSPGKLVVELV
jgi:hypothetical protein